jgi:hypothetical protein
MPEPTAKPKRSAVTGLTFVTAVLLCPAMWFGI